MVARTYEQEVEGHLTVWGDPDDLLERVEGRFEQSEPG